MDTSTAEPTCETRCERDARPIEPSWKVYGLIDPRTGWVFYVGMTQSILRRLAAHKCQKQSAAWEMCQDIMQAGSEVSYCIFGEFRCEEMARFLETRLIVSLPITFNRTGFEEGYKLWAPFRARDASAPS